MGLNSRQGGGGDLPSLDLAFALDRSFTTDPAAAGAALITSRRGPVAKFSRGTGATQVNAAGLIEYAPENLMTRSEEFDHSGWIKLRTSVDDNATTDPVGNLNADKLIEDSSTGTHMTYRTAVLSSLVPHTFSVYAKADGRNFMYLQCGDGFPVNCHAYFDLSTGTTGTVGANATANIEPAGNGWYRCSVTATPSSLTTNIFYIQPTAVNGSTSYAGDGVSGIFLWGAQVERASTARTYYPTTTAAFHAPRFDHDPITSVCKGLLIEESRENFALHSQSFANSYWSSFATATATDDITTSPSGVANSASRITATSGTDTSRLRVRLFSLTAGSSQRTVSVLLKAGTHGFGILSMSFNKVGVGTVRLSQVIVNLSTGSAVQTGILTGFSFSVTQHPDGWWRIAISATSNASIAVEDQVVMAFGMSYNGAGGSGFFTGTETVFGWGGQVEAGAFPLSYIPTTSGTAARSADVCSIIGDDFSSFYNQSEGTAVTKVTNALGIESNTQYPFSFSGASSANLLIAYRVIQSSLKIGRFASIVSSSDTLSDSANVGTLSDGATDIIGFAIKLNDFAGSLDGNLITDNTVTLPTVDRMFIGSRFDGTRHWNGHIARIQYFRKRLSNAKLQTITTP